MWEKLIFPLKIILKTDHLSHGLLIHYTVDTEFIPYSQLNLLTTYIHPHTNKPHFIKKNPNKQRNTRKIQSVQQYQLQKPTQSKSK